MSTHGADQALLVAWGGVNKAAKQELRSQFFKVRVWSADEMLDALMRTYPVLDEDIRAELPLKQIWALVEEAGQRAALTIAALPEAPRGITLENPGLALSLLSTSTVTKILQSRNAHTERANLRVTFLPQVAARCRPVLSDLRVLGDNGKVDATIFLAISDVQLTA